jgi:hypothetical protein
LRYGVLQLSRPTRRRVHAAVAGFSLGLWLFLLVAETWSPLHAWLHGGSIPDNDSCAIVALAHGTVDCGAPGDFVTLPVAVNDFIPGLESLHFHSAIAFLPAGRAPPSLGTVS